MTKEVLEVFEQHAQQPCGSKSYRVKLHLDQRVYQCLDCGFRITQQDDGTVEVNDPTQPSK